MSTQSLDTVELGTTGLRITRIGFGAWAIGGRATHQDDESIAAIGRALELGVNWIDTAASYGSGRSEALVGRRIAGLVARPYIFTKAPLVDGPGRSVVQGLGRDSLRRAVEGSLERLGVDAIDLYQLHGRVPDQDLEAAWSALTQLREQGLVRHIGVTDFDVSQLERLRQVAPVESVQPQYSLLERGAESALLPYAERQAIGVIVSAPMGSGMLNGCMSRELIERLSPDEWRKHSARFREPELSRVAALLDRVTAVAARYDTTPGAVGLAWALRHPAVDGAVVGFPRRSYVDAILTAAGLRLSEADVALIQSVPDSSAA